ncbi:MULTISPECIES: DUF1566 domain-containing protein [Methylobacillus]|uniref:Uncharacterized protein n=1 Tax=Methylobacillus flagellatus (strain ATCC 51484 / DSM 6875 / VKM B-1610 / KT) TaxID=265072 RepID=Q1H297_METFK|nr:MULTISPECIES: DUF1566 domain-containing protein [Methylobacillus]ABE49390.1 hypothetical protein Mfla_1122 [Methylobacillus flagellatus KT]MPS48042.1 DUF1566 domain-containing protein [Methylobacillus sp.]
MYFKPALLASALLFASINVHAELTSYNPNGVELVYSSVSDVTWTKDANLFKTLYDADNTLIDKIIAVTPTFNDPHFGLQTIDASDFNTSNGRVSWWGGFAFVDYLNSVNYGGSDQWRLPTVVNAQAGYNTPTNGTAAGDELPELFYQELGGIQGKAIPDTDMFDNEQSWTYWTGTEHASLDTFAWAFYTSIGNQYFFSRNNFQFHVWAVTPGLVAAVPEASTYAMLLAGLGVLGAVARRRRAL